MSVESVATDGNCQVIALKRQRPCLCVCVYIYICVCVCVYIYIYMYIYRVSRGECARLRENVP